MPRISNEYLDCVIYLYRSQHEALEGINIGGSGFLVSVPSEVFPPPSGYVYAVTNKHVVEGGACSIRFNLRSGGIDVAEFKLSEWTLAKDDDLAVITIPGALADAILAKCVGISQLLTEVEAKRLDVGPGDEVVVIGRFVNQEGKQRNIPTVRFGFVAQQASEPIEYEGQFQKSYLCEVKSIGGFSGSPVFLAPDWKSRAGQVPEFPAYTHLLGVDWAHIQNWDCARDADGNKLEHILIPTNTGMMAVVPAWKLEALLKSPKLTDRRRASDAADSARHRAPKIGLDSSSGSFVTDLPASEENPKHREDFNSLVDAATRKPKQDDQT